MQITSEDFIGAGPCHFDQGRRPRGEGSQTRNNAFGVPEIWPRMDGTLDSGPDVSTSLRFARHDKRWMCSGLTSPGPATKNSAVIGVNRPALAHKKGRATSVRPMMVRQCGSYFATLNWYSYAWFLSKSFAWQRRTKPSAVFAYWKGLPLYRSPGRPSGKVSGKLPAVALTR